jgi:hypothetical protein
MAGSVEEVRDRTEMIEPSGLQRESGLDRSAIAGGSAGHVSLSKLLFGDFEFGNVRTHRTSTE